MKTIAIAVLVLFTMVFLSGCGGGSHQDLRDYIKTVKSKPAGKIDDLPVYPAYESFIYSATQKRSPFDRPIDIEQRVFASKNSNVRPNLNRVKEPLEKFDLSSLQMSGWLYGDDQLYALILDGAGEVTKVKSGNYLGKNHGRIIAIDKTKLEIIEIVSDGLDGWVERPRVLALVKKD